MKKLNFLCLTVLVMFLMASCGGVDKKEITPEQITKLYNEKAAELCMDKVYTTIDTGYYELNNESKRFELQKLAHAGVIEYSVERFAWFNKCTDIKNTHLKTIQFYCADNGDLDHEQKVYGRGEVISYNLEEHFMVKVQIKRKYQPMVVDAVPQPSTVDEDMEAPLYKRWDEDQLRNNEEWPEMIAPAIPAPPTERKEIKCRPQKEKPAPKVQQQKTYTPKKEVVRPVREPRCVAVDKETKRRYDEAKAMEVKGTANILAYEIKAVLARNIQIFNKEDHSLAARCEVIVKSDNVTPQGHILMDDIIDGIPAKLNIKMTYFEDKGWVIDADEREETTQVKDKKGRKKTVTNKVCEFPRPEIDPRYVIRDIEAEAEAELE